MDQATTDSAPASPIQPIEVSINTIRLYYNRGVALYERNRFFESLKALNMALALIRGGSKDKDHPVHIQLEAEIKAMIDIVEPAKRRLDKLSLIHI